MYSLYLHLPFCTHRCAYCDFNTYAGQEDAIPAYVDALCREIDFVGSRFLSPDLGRGVRGEGKVHTIFFGGGTPSLLSPEQFESILKAIQANFSLTEDAEITMEANPGTISHANLLELRKLGINRISFGVQSANTEELRILERAHSFFDVIEAVSSARKAGFDNLNLDLIYGLPEQGLKTWQTTVKRILDLHPEHISAYALTLEHGTPFGRWSAKGLLAIPDPDLAAEMYEWASDTFEANGYVQYEISNWAKDLASSRAQHRRDAYNYPSYACRHNLQYWRGLPYLAFGAGAHGYADGYRYSNVLGIKSYIERLTDFQSRTLDLLSKSPGGHSLAPPVICSANQAGVPWVQVPGSAGVSKYVFPLTPATVNHHKQTLQDDMSEFMMTGLRLIQEGISENEFQVRFGSSIRAVYQKEIGELLKLGLLEEHEPLLPNRRGDRGGGLKLTQRGRLLGNQVFLRFVD